MANSWSRCRNSRLQDILVLQKELFLSRNLYLRQKISCKRPERTTLEQNITNKESARPSRIDQGQQRLSLHRNTKRTSRGRLWNTTVNGLKAKARCMKERLFVARAKSTYLSVENIGQNSLKFENIILVSLTLFGRICITGLKRSC